MTWNPEIDTDAFDADSLDELAGRYPNTCNGFAFSYLEDHADHEVVVKDAYVDATNGAEHCYVFDATLGLTIDTTLGQFNDCPDAGVWEGDHHPYAAEWEEIFEWTDREAFSAHYSALGNMENPFYC